MQTGGGVRSRDDVERLLAAGAARVVVGRWRCESPNAVPAGSREFGAERITVALDCRQDEAGIWRLPVHGWTETAACHAGRARRALSPPPACEHLLCTDIARDGMLSGPNLELYAHLRGYRARLAVQASGGVRDVADVAAATAQGCAGIVLGRALLEGKLDLAEALAC